MSSPVMSDLTFQHVCRDLLGLHAPVQRLLGASKELHASEVMNIHTCGSNSAPTSPLFTLHFIGLQLH